MKASLEMQKPVDKITAEDLAAFPLWEFAIDEEDRPEQDETWIRPVPKKKVPKNAYSQLVATDFTMADGTVCPGFVVVTTAENPISIDPGALLFTGKYCCLPHLSRSESIRQGYPRVNDMRDQLLLNTGKSEGDVFPIRYALRIPISSEKNVRSGTLC